MKIYKLVSDGIYLLILWRFSNKQKSKTNPRVELKTTKDPTTSFSSFNIEIALSDIVVSLQTHVHTIR